MRILASLFLILLFTASLPAQDQSLFIDAEKASQSDLQWQLTLTFTGHINDFNGRLFIQMPAGVKAVPQQIRINEESVWLKKSANTPELSNRVHWQWNEDLQGIILRMAPLLLAPGSQVQMQLQSSLQQQLPENAAIVISTVTVGTGGTLQTTETVASQNLVLQ